MLPVLHSGKLRLLACAIGINNDQGDSYSTVERSSLMIRVDEKYDTKVNLHYKMVIYCMLVLLFSQMF